MLRMATVRKARAIQAMDIFSIESTDTGSTATISVPMGSMPTDSTLAYSLAMDNTVIESTATDNTDMVILRNTTNYPKLLP